MFLIFVYIFCVFYACWSYYVWTLDRRSSSIRMLPGRLPFIGHGHKIIGDGKKFLNFFDNKMGEELMKSRIVKCWYGPRIMFCTADPDLALKFVNTYYNPNYYMSFLKPWLGEGLITAGGEHWKRSRKLLNPTFSLQVLNSYMSTYNQEAKILIERLRGVADTEEFDYRRYFNQSSLNVVCKTVLGLSENDKNFASKEYVGATTKFLESFSMRLQHIWMQPNFLYNWSRAKKNQDEAVKVLKKASFDVLHEKKNELNSNSDRSILDSRKNKSSLDLLLELEAEGYLTEKEVREHVDTFIASGFDTISTALGYILTMIGSFPDVQQRLFEEIIDICGLNNDVTKHDLPKLVYVEAVIKETLRLYTIVPLIGRYADADINFENFTVPAGAVVVVNSRAIHRSKHWGDDAEAFKPDRWLNNASLPDCNSAFVSFGIGKRTCIGRTYAMMSMKTTLVHLIRAYRVKSDYRNIKLDYNGMLKPYEGYHISLYKR